MSNVELQYLQEREGGFSPESEPVETYLDGDGTSPLHPAAHPQIVTRAELGISYSGAASDGSGRGSAPRTGISPEHLDVKFESCFRENKSTSTIRELYKGLGVMFHYSKLVVYNFFVITLGFIVAFIWAVIAGFVAFYVNFVWSPSLRLALLLVASILPLATEPLRVLLSPFADAIARVFRQIRVNATLDGGLFNAVSGAETQSGPLRYVYYIILSIVLCFLAGINVFIFVTTYYVCDYIFRVTIQNSPQ